MTESGEFVEIQSTAERKTFKEEQLKRMLDLSRKGIAELIALQRKTLGISK
jgi:ribonuclease PH